jgi:hypothetical protein
MFAKMLWFNLDRWGGAVKWASVLALIAASMLNRCTNSG